MAGRGTCRPKNFSRTCSTTGNDNRSLINLRIFCNKEFEFVLAAGSGQFSGDAKSNEFAQLFSSGNRKRVAPLADFRLKYMFPREIQPPAQ